MKLTVTLSSVLVLESNAVGGSYSALFLGFSMSAEVITETTEMSARNCHEITFQICFGKCHIRKHFPKQECKVISKQFLRTFGQAVLRVFQLFRELLHNKYRNGDSLCTNHFQWTLQEEP